MTKHNSNKVIFYIDSVQKGGGANRVISNLTRSFAENDIETILITDVGPKSGILEYNICDSVRRICLDEILVNVKSNYKRIKEIRNIIKTEKPRAVVSFMGPPNIRMTIASIGVDTRKVASVRSNPNVEYGTGIKKIIKNIILSFADGLVLQTEDSAKYFIKKIQKKSKIIFNPVNKDFFEIERRSDTKNIITVGRLESFKNQELLIQAFKKICDKFPDEKLIIYGEGSIRNKLEGLVQTLELYGRVELPGNTEDVAGEMAKAKIFVLPSDYEGMPNALMEAMTVGIPAISTDCPCGGPRTLITKKEEGKIVPCNDISIMAEAIEELLLDEKLRAEMSFCEKERANLFKPEIILEEWKTFLQIVA